MNFKVTFLMPTHNDEETITDSINSLYQQDYDNWELIIINDGGRDLKDLLKQFLSDKRIKLIQNSQNEGQLKALESSLPYIEGDLITLFHSDDLLVPNSLKRLVSYFENSNIDGIFADLITIDEKGKITGRLKTINKLSPFVEIDIILRNAQGGVLNDVFFVTKQYFFASVVPNYIQNDLYYWLSFDKPFKIPYLIKVKPWYKYRIHQKNYIHTDICKFILLRDYLYIIYTLTQKHFIPLENFQSLFWRALYKISFMKDIYSYTFHPLFFKRKPKFDTKYYAYLYKKYKTIVYLLYKNNIPQYFNYIDTWFINCKNDIKLNINDLSRFDIPDNDMDMFKMIQDDNSIMRKTLIELSNQGITTFIVNNRDDYKKMKYFIRHSSLPLHIICEN